MTPHLDGDCLAEREAFEAHWYNLYHSGSIRARQDGSYMQLIVQKAWESWQARAALSASKQGGKAEQVAEDLRGVWLTAPERVWLDLGEPDMREMDAYTVANFRDIGEVTWSEDNATGCGIKYVRADLALPPAPAAQPQGARNDL